MNVMEYHEFTRELSLKLEANTQVLGLIAVGSMAEQDYYPDEWSDHDFFVIVESGTQEFFRRDLRWLPRSERIILSFQETEHGMKVLFKNGHMLEFAVFDLNEMQLARVNRCRILIDKGGVAEGLNRVVSQTIQWSEGLRSDDQFLFGQFLANLLVGSGRFQRGERLSALFFIYGSATRHLAFLISKYVPSQNPEVLDNIDPLRRFEVAYPALADEFGRILTGDGFQTAHSLLQLAHRELRQRMPEYPEKAVQALQTLLAQGKIS